MQIITAIRPDGLELDKWAVSSRLPAWSEREFNSESAKSQNLIDHSFCASYTLNNQVHMISYSLRTGFLVQLAADSEKPTEIMIGLFIDKEVYKQRSTFCSPYFINELYFHTTRPSYICALGLLQLRDIW